MNTIKIYRPVVTEKAIAATKANYYGLVVEEDATKTQVKDTVEKLFGVHVVAVNIIKNAGKTKRVGKMRRSIKTPAIKKAFVKLAAGQTLDTVPMVADEAPKK